MITVEEIAEVNRPYGFGPVSEDQKVRMTALREDFRDTALMVLKTTPPSRARSLALTHLQTAKMFAVQAVVDEEV